METINRNLQQNSFRISYKKIFNIIVSRWYWMLATLSIALITTYIYLNVVPKSYTAEATLKFEEKRSEISELINVRNVYERSNKLQSEQFVIRSRTVLTNAANQLKYPIAYFTEGYVNQVELYPKVPFQAVVLQEFTGTEQLRDYRIVPLREDSYLVEYRDQNKQIRRTYKIDEPVSTRSFKFAITGRFKPRQFNVSYYIHFNHPDELISRANKGLSMAENKNTNILSFTQSDHNPVFAANILNAILEEYIRYDQEQRSRSANQTIQFLDTLQNRLAEVVSSSGTAFEKFKVRSKMLNIPGITDQALARLELLERQKADLDLQTLKTKLLVEQLKRKNETGAINYDLQGLNDTFLSNLLSQFNLLLLKKQDQLSTYKAGSEMIKDTDGQLSILRQALINNIEAQQHKNAEARAHLQQQIAKHQEQFSQLPSAEKDFINLQSTFDVNQKVYAYLNQKKLEAQISRASITPNATVVNKAISQFTATAPLTKNAYKTALLLGLLAGIALIFVVRALNPYIFDRETVEQLTTTPIVGAIRKYPSTLPNAAGFFLAQGSSTIFAESIRALRTNISFLAPDIDKKIICITSETAGEGKSFTALNLAHSLSMIDKRVIVIAADLRKSILHRAFSADNRLGLSTYLSGQVGLEDIIVHHSDWLSFVTGGPVPPNPSELLYGQRMTSMLLTLKGTYDYVIVDSAPVGLVSDGIPMLKAADINLFIIRAGLSRYHAAVLPDRLSASLNIRNFHIVLNGINHDKLHTPYYSNAGYRDVDAPDNLQGYLSGTSRKRWWSFN